MREVNLVSYLPPFLSGYKETNETLEAEDPEFRLVWDAARRVLYNEFIATADEYGISRYEKMLRIYPGKEDTLESRRSRVQIRWSSTLPYTEKMLLERLIAVCGEKNFTFTKNYDRYRIEIEVSMDLYGQLEELENTIGIMVPGNMVVVLKNKISYRLEEAVCIAGGISFTEAFRIVGDSVEYFSIKMQEFFGANTSVTECVKIGSEG